MRRSPSVQIQPYRQQIHRLRQLSEMQTRRAAGKTERHRRPMPAMQKRQPRRAQIPLRQTVLQLQHLSRLQLRHLEPAHCGDLPKMRMAGIDHQNHQTLGRGKSLPAKRMRLERTDRTACTERVRLGWFEREKVV